MPRWVRLLLLSVLIFTAAVRPDIFHIQQTGCSNTQSYVVADTDEFSPYIEINDNLPSFTESELSTIGYIKLSDLDYLGRCGKAYACIGPETLPTEKRGDISMVKPSGWQSVQYPDIILKIQIILKHILLIQTAVQSTLCHINDKGLGCGLSCHVPCVTRIQRRGTCCQGS